MLKLDLSFQNVDSQEITLPPISQRTYENAPDLNKSKTGFRHSAENALQLPQTNRQLSARHKTELGSVPRSRSISLGTRESSPPKQTATQKVSWSGYALCLEQYKNHTSFFSGKQAADLSHRDVDMNTFLQVVKEKEELNKILQQLSTHVAAMEEESVRITENRASLQEELKTIHKESKVTETEQAAHEEKKRIVKCLEEDIAQQKALKENIMKERSGLEDRIDNINADIATQIVLKRVIESKLDNCTDEKKKRLKEKAALMDTSAAIKEKFRKQSEHLLKQKHNQTSIYTSTKQKSVALRLENDKLQIQLEKSKVQVNDLIKQIEVYEAKAAREFKAERKAKEAAKDSQTKYPTGTVTIAFSDVQCSTYQWEKFSDAMSDAIELHNRILREQLKITGGYEVKTEGDSFMVAFHSAVSAVWWCLFVQEALMAARWPESLIRDSTYAKEEKDENGNLVYRGLRVRMGIHMGKPECKVDSITGRTDYFGGMVNRAARIASIACGGQILMSGRTWEAARREVTGIFVESLGDHFLKGLSSPEQIMQILPKALVGRSKSFPQLVTTKDNPIQEQEIIKFHEYESDELSADNEFNSSNDETTEKLTAIVQEIDATLKAQQEKQQLREITKQIQGLEKQIKEAEDFIAQGRAEEDVLKYQVEKAKAKNKLYEVDIAQIRTDKEVALELIEGFALQKQQTNAVLVSATAKSFCVLIRQSLLESQMKRTEEELHLYEKHVTESETSEMTADRQMQQLKERIQLIQDQLAQTKAESDYFIKQVQEIEKSIQNNKMFVPKENDKMAVSSVILQSSSSESEPETAGAPSTSTSLSKLQKRVRVLEDEVLNESLERDLYRSKVRGIQSDISKLEGALKPALLKKIKVLDQELIQVKGEKDILMKQMDLLKDKHLVETKAQNKVFEEVAQKLAVLKNRNAKYQQKLARLTHKNKNITLEEHANNLANEIFLHFRDHQDLHNPNSEESTVSEVQLNEEGIDANESMESYLDEQLAVDEELTQNQSEENGETEITVDNLTEEETNVVDNPSELQ